MTECAECLSALSTVRLSEVTPGSAIALHAARCPMCMQVVEEVRQSEYRLSVGLIESATGHTSKDMAWAAIEGSEFRRRQSIARWVRGGLAVAALVVFGVFMETRTGISPGQRPELRVVTLRLRCLSPAAAADLVTPYLRSSGSVVYRVDDAHAITLKAPPREIAVATSQVDKFDDPQACALPTGNPSAENPDAPVTPQTRNVEAVRAPSRR